MSSIIQADLIEKLSTEKTILPGFEHIKRYWDHKHQSYTSRIMPGEFYVSTEKEVITTVLGSCVSACIRDPEAGIGGMNHFMLPREEGEIASKMCSSKLARYGNHAMDKIIKTILSYGGKRERLEIKLFGGGKILESMTDVGQWNIDFVHDYLRKKSLPVTAEDLGGLHPRKILYFPHTGRVLMCKLPLSLEEQVVKRDLQYCNKLGHLTVAGKN